MTYHLILFAVLLIFIMASVMLQNLLYSAIMLALGSVTVSLIMFTFSAPWAGVFELSVCAALLPVLVIGTIKLIDAGGRQDLDEGNEDNCGSLGFNIQPVENRIKFRILPLVVSLIAVLGWIFFIPFFEALSKYPYMNSLNRDLGKIIWAGRSQDLIAQITILTAIAMAMKSILHFSGGKNKESKE